MENPRTYRIIVSITFALAVIIGCEHYVFPVSNREEVLDNGYADIDRSRHGTSEAWYFVTKEGSDFRVPEQLYNRILIGETIRVGRSLIFRRPIRIGWYRNNEVYTFPLSVMTNNYLGEGIMIITILFGLLVLTGVFKITTPVRARLVYLYAVFVAGELVFYLTY